MNAPRDGVAGRRIRAVLHAHSLWSYDGSWQLDAIARLFARMGADAVLMTEHDTGFAPERFEEFRRACAAASRQGCLLVPGIEYSCPDNDIHILTWGLERFLAEHRPVHDTLSAVRDGGGIAVFAHPVRRDAWRLFQDAWVDRLDAIEIWNRKSDGLAPGDRAMELLRQTGLCPTVGVDFHRLKHLYPLSMGLTLAPGADLTPKAVLDALRTGTGVPLAFGRPVLTPEGEPARLHPRLERARRTLKRLRPRRS